MDHLAKSKRANDLLSDFPMTMNQEASRCSLASRKHRTDMMLWVEYCSCRVHTTCLQMITEQWFVSDSRPRRIWKGLRRGSLIGLESASLLICLYPCSYWLGIHPTVHIYPDYRHRGSCVWSIWTSLHRKTSSILSQV